MRSTDYALRIVNVNAKRIVKRGRLCVMWKTLAGMGLGAGFYGLSGVCLLAWLFGMFTAARAGSFGLFAIDFLMPPVGVIHGLLAALGAI